MLPRFPKDTTDRNRTSPFAFTGNKFEFRMLGSSASISEANIILNTAVADVLGRYADALENAPHLDSALHDLIQAAIREHRRILFNGNGYDEAWVEEAKRRGLLNLRATPECMAYFLDAKNVELFERNRVLSETELHARYEIMLSHYAKEVKIEALTMLDMIRKDVLPAVSRFTGELSRTAREKGALCGASACRYETELTGRLSELTGAAWRDAAVLEEALEEAGRSGSTEEFALVCWKKLLPTMAELRRSADAMEAVTDKKFWPYPSYGEILFSVY